MRERERKSEEGSTRCGERAVREEKEREKESGEGHVMEKTERGGQGNKNVVDEGSCRCGGATVRTWRVYLSCFYRLARTSGPGYADEDEEDENDDEDDDGGGDDEEKARDKVGEGRTARSGERWKVAARGSATAGGRG